MDAAQDQVPGRIGVDVADFCGVSGRLTYYSPRHYEPDHEHADAHLSFVLTGGFEETERHGDRDRFAGDRIARGAGARHAVRIGPSGSLILNLRAPGGEPGFGPSRRAPAGAQIADWLVAAHARLQREPASACVQALARDAGVHRVHFGRQFAAAYGLSPSAFRMRSMVAQAVTATLIGGETLADAALIAGFADQAHLTRAVKAQCGVPIGRLRRLLAPAQAYDWSPGAAT